MLDALTIKEWLLVYFVAGSAMAITGIALLIRANTTASRLLYDNELVRLLKEFLGK